MSCKQWLHSFARSVSAEIRPQFDGRRLRSSTAGNQVWDYRVEEPMQFGTTVWSKAVLSARSRSGPQFSVRDASRPSRSSYLRPRRFDYKHLYLDKLRPKPPPDAPDLQGLRDMSSPRSLSSRLDYDGMMAAASGGQAQITMGLELFLGRELLEALPPEDLVVIMTPQLRILPQLKWGHENLRMQGKYVLDLCTQLHVMANAKAGGNEAPAIRPHAAADNAEDVVDTGSGTAADTTPKITGDFDALVQWSEMTNPAVLRDFVIASGFKNNIHTIRPWRVVQAHKGAVDSFLMLIGLLCDKVGFERVNRFVGTRVIEGREGIYRLWEAQRQG